MFVKTAAKILYCTRDAIDTTIKISYVFIDTAGLRQKQDSFFERYSIIRTVAAPINIVIDAIEGVTEQGMQRYELLFAERKGIIVYKCMIRRLMKHN